MGTFFVLFGVPLVLVLLGTILIRRIDGQELALRVLVQVVAAGISAWVIYHTSTSDTEVWNGIVVAKDSERVSCSHSYPCNCRQVCSSDSKGNQSCSTVCDTCYDHSYDVNWRVFTSNDELIHIDRVDRQGVREPPRWAVVRLNDPTAIEHTYTNYIKAAPGTLFKRQGLVEKYVGALPVYPGKVYDYYRVDRFLSLDVAVSDAPAWNQGLAVLNADLGRAKQVNIIVVLTRQPREWYFALEEAWLGAKKNDVVLVVGVGDGLKPDWVEVMAWAEDDLFRVKLHDAVLGMPSVGREPVLSALRTIVRDHFKRKPMAQFEYLRASIVPSTTQWVVSILVGFVTAIAFAWVYPFLIGHERFPRSRRYRF